MVFQNIKSMTSMVVITSFLLTHNAWCGKTTPPPSEEPPQERGQVAAVQRRGKTLILTPQLLQEMGLEKLIIAATLLPLAEAQSQNAETIGTNFYGTILPSLVGGFFLSALAAPLIKDGIYKGYSKFASTRFDTLSDFIDTTIVLRWPHESLRWGYFGLLRGNRDIGDIPILSPSSPEKNWWGSFYEWSTSQPYSVELRHAERLENFRPNIVKMARDIDEELEKTGGWARKEISRKGLFRGFSYQNGICTLHLRGGDHNEAFDGIEPSEFENIIAPQDRYTAWKAFWKPFKDNEISILPSHTFDLLQTLVLDSDETDEDAIKLLSPNENTLCFSYGRGFIIALKKTHCELPSKEEVLETPPPQKNKKKTHKKKTVNEKGKEKVKEYEKEKESASSPEITNKEVNKEETEEV